MLPVAMVGLVLVEHGPLMLGLVLGVRGAAGSLFALLTGALLTRVRKSTALVFNDSVQLLVMLGFALGPDAGPWLLALAALSGVSGSVVEPASGSLMPVIVPRDQLQQANALRNIVGRAAGITGPATAGVLLALVDVRSVFLIIAALFAICVLTLVWIREASPAPERATESMGTSLREGWREVVRRPWVLAVIAVATVQAPATLAPGFVLLPIVVADSYPEPVYGLALSCMATCQLVGGVVAARWTPARPGLVSLLGVLCFPLTLLGLALTVAVPVLLVGYAATGVGFMMFGVYWYTALQKSIPQDRLSVVISIDQVGSFGLEPVGYAVAGALAETVGARTVLFWAAAVGMVTSLLPLLVPGVSRLADGLPRLTPNLYRKILPRRELRGPAGRRQWRPCGPRQRRSMDPAPAHPDPAATTTTHSPEPAAGAERERARRRPGVWAQLRPLILRLHFYAGVLVGPFILVAAVSGLLYV
jgi:MFS family permease